MREQDLVSWQNFGVEILSVNPFFEGVWTRYSKQRNKPYGKTKKQRSWLSWMSE